MAVKLFKIVSAFYPGFAREKVKKCFVISKVSAGNRALCRGQHAACNQQVDRSCSTLL
jgi:hypothetical protein